MGVYVKDMQMPSGCGSCDFANFFSDGEPYCRRLMKRVKASSRLPDCPLHDVPSPHGKLIDVNEACEKYPVDADPRNGYLLYKLNDELSTIIPAEEEAKT